MAEEEKGADAQEKDDILDKAFQHPVVAKQREDMLAYKAKARALEEKMAAIEAEKAASEAKRLEEEKRFQELYEKEKSERTALVEKMKTEKIASAIREAAVKAGAVDSTDPNFANLSGVSIGDDGAVTGAEEAVLKVMAERPYLKASTGAVETFASKPAKAKASVTWADLMADSALMYKIKKDQPEVFKRLAEEESNKYGR